MEKAHPKIVKDAKIRAVAQFCDKYGKSQEDWIGRGCWREEYDIFTGGGDSNYISHRVFNDDSVSESLIPSFKKSAIPIDII